LTEWFIEVSKSVKRKTPPKMIKLNELPEWQEKHRQSDQGLFSTIYQYPTDDPYVGGVISDFYVDLDCEEDPDKARKEAIALLKTIINDYGIPEENTEIAFSGMKGISIRISHNVFNAESRADLPLIWKSIVQHLISKLDLKTVDTKVYERRRLWRLLNSKHQKSGLYKIPLTLTELEKLSVEEIKEKAVEPRFQAFVAARASPVPKAASLFQEHLEKVEEWKQKRKESFRDIEIRSFGEDPPCVQRLFEQGAEEDARNISLFHLAIYWAQKGFSEPEIIKLGYEFAEHSKQGFHPFPEANEIETTVHSAYEGVQNGRYSIGCSSEAFAPLCDRENCPFFNPLKLQWKKIGEPITYDDWRGVVRKNFPKLWPYAETCASTAAILLIEDALPFALILQGAPGSGKTTTLDFFGDFIHSHQTDKFTAASFVSHAAQKSEKELKKIDLLPKIKHKLLVTPELNTLFGLPPEKLREDLTVLTRVLDGRGLKTESGVHGTRGYKGDYFFTWIGATTPIEYKVWNLFGNLGARMYFVEMEQKRKTKKEHRDELKRGTYKQKVKECNEATLRFLKGIWTEDRIKWNRGGDPDEIIDHIIEMAQLLVRLRGKVNVAVKEDYTGEKVYYSTPTIEFADRAREALYNLARGHAIIQRRRQINENDLPLVVDVALSSAPLDRVNAFKFLLQKGEVTTSDIMEALSCSRRTARRSMETLEILNLVDLEQSEIPTEAGIRFGYTMRLKEDLSWFTTDEFKRLWRRKSITPTEIELSEKRKVVEKLSSWEDLFKKEGGREEKPEE